MDSYRIGSTGNCSICVCFNNPGIRMTSTDKVFSGCVKTLKWTAEKTGMTYGHVNLWVFCVIWPAVTVGLVVACVSKK